MSAKKYGNWVVDKPLGEDGGQGTTFLVHREDDEQFTPRVLKLISGKGPFGNRYQRFRNELDAGVKLDHQNLTRVIDPEPDREKPFVVTEYCTRGALSATSIRDKTLIERLELFRGICAGVAYAHEHGVVHRDLKPDNIFLRADGTPVVGDFGLCFFLDGQGKRTTALDEVVGSRWYLSPECEGGLALDVGTSCDVYSLGKLLYWILSAKVFPRERHRAADYNLIRNNSDFEMIAVYELLDKMLITNPLERIQNAGEVATEIDATIRKIVLRKRVIELARYPINPFGPAAPRLASFRVGSLVAWRELIVGSAKILGFAASGQTLAAWGTSPDEHGHAGCVSWIGGPIGRWEE